MSYLAELHAERQQRLARLGVIPNNGQHHRPSPLPPVSAERASAEAREWLEAMPLAAQSRAAALAAADGETCYVWALFLDRIAVAVDIDDTLHLTVVLLTGAIFERVIYLANRGRLS